MICQVTSIGLQVNLVAVSLIRKPSGSVGRAAFPRPPKLFCSSVDHQLSNHLFLAKLQTGNPQQLPRLQPSSTLECSS